MSTQARYAPSADVLKQILQILLTLPTEKLVAVQDYLLFLQSNRNGVHPAHGNGAGHEPALTEYDILLTKQPDNGYIARPVLMPEIVVSGADEKETLAQVCGAIANQQTQSRIVRVQVPTYNETVDDPWLRFAGMWEDDPNWEQFQADIASHRQLIDAQMQPDLINE